jgi:hypothetical protein
MKSFERIFVLRSVIRAAICVALIAPAASAQTPSGDPPEISRDANELPADVRPDPACVVRHTAALRSADDS